MNPANQPGGKPGEPAPNVPHYERPPLSAFFLPRSVAVVGASEKPGSVARHVLWNLVSSPFGGTVFPVNAQRQSVLGIKAYGAINEISEPIDLAVITTPAPQAPEAVSECVAAGVRAAIVISGGFRETGPEGLEREHEIKRRMKGSRLRVLGPNCLGVMNPATGLNATWSPAMARPGNVAFLSQSGALCAAILDWSVREMVGFSAVVSVGSMLDVGWGDLIDYFGDDAQTHAIVCYMESIGNARAFLSAAREVSLAKPVIVIKAGRTAEAARAAATLTGTLTGSDEVLDAAFRRTGVLRVNSLSDLFYMAEVLAKQPRPRGNRLIIFTNAGGPAVLAADELTFGGGRLADLAPQTMEALNALLPPHWSRGNPVDILGDATPERMSKALELVMKDPSCDGLLFVTAPQAVSKPTAMAELLRPYAQSGGKPVLASFMGGADVAVGNEILNRAGIPTFPFSDTAARAFNYMWRYSYNLRGIYETPVIREAADPNRTAAEQIVQRVRAGGRTRLTEQESQQLLATYRIPLADKEVVRGKNGYELMLGSRLDPQFGPVVCFGVGGQLAEIHRDHALALPPLNTTLARRLMEQTRIYAALQGTRGRPPADLAGLEQLLVRFSQLVAEQPGVKEADINPVLAFPEEIVALDARVLLHGPEITDAELPRSAVRPYPTQYAAEWTLKDGVPVMIRPIRPEDEPLMIHFHEKLSDRTVYLRYFQPLKLSQRVAHERLMRICFIDYGREIVLVAVRKHPETANEEEVIAVGRLSRLHGINAAECAALIRDDYQHQGLGGELCRRLLEIARAEGLDRVISIMMAENRDMRAIFKRLGFHFEIDMEDRTVRAELDLRKQ
jgi:acetyltransferase